MLSYEHGNGKTLGGVHVLAQPDGVELLEGVHVVDLLLDGGGHERRKPPAGHLGPDRRVDDVKGLQPLLVLVTKSRVHITDPVVAGNVLADRPSVEVDDHLHTKVVSFKKKT